MNIDEEGVENYLKTLNPICLQFEPEGKNTTPDFLLDNKIAIEARRLNKNYFNGDIVSSKENLEQPIFDYINTLIRSFDKSDYTNSVYIDIIFSEPKTIRQSSYLKNIKMDLNKVFKEHALKVDIAQEYEISDFLKISFEPTSKKDTLYRHPSLSSPFFWVVSEYRRNIQHSIDEKAEKIGAKFDNYQEWWLVLVDHIFCGMSDEDYHQIKSSDFNKKKFSKIIVISLNERHNVYEF